MRRFPTSKAVACALAVVLSPLATACAGPGNFVWVDDLPAAQSAQAAESDYLIREGDLVNIRVFDQEPLSTRARVRADGRLAMPALGDVDVRGKRPSALKAELETRLKPYVNTPSVTVTVEESQPITISVLGEVSHPGSYPLDPHAGIAQVIAAAGGLTDYASRDRIFVVRSAPQPIRVRFTYEHVSRGEGRASNFALRHGDLVVVE
jgi:polysaccharide export outer membrane protein